MSNLDLPFWVLTQRAQAAPPAHEPCESDAHALGFSSTERLTEFLRARHSGEWRIRLLNSDDELFLLLADLHQEGVPGICMNVEQDGSGGLRLSLVDLIEQFERRRRSDASARN